MMAGDATAIALSGLADDILVQIFSYAKSHDLMTLALTCKRFGGKSRERELSLTNKVARNRVEDRMKEGDGGIISKYAAVCIVQQAHGVIWQREHESWMATDYRLEQIFAPFDAKNYVLVVEAHGGRDHSGDVDNNPAFQSKIFCEAYEGESVEQFFRCGSTSVLLDRPKPWSGAAEGRRVVHSRGGGVHFGQFALKYRISVARKSDGKVIDLCNASSCGRFGIESRYEDIGINGGTISGASFVNNRVLFGLSFGGGQYDTALSGDDDYWGLDLEFGLIHDDDSPYPVLGFHTYAMNTSYLYGSHSMDDDDWPHGITFAHFIVLCEQWKTDFTQVAEWRSLAGDSMPDAVLAVIRSREESDEDSSDDED